MNPPKRSKSPNSQKFTSTLITELGITKDGPVRKDFRKGVKKEFLSDDLVSFLKNECPDSMNLDGLGGYSKYIQSTKGAGMSGKIMGSSLNCFNQNSGRFVFSIC